MVHVLDMEDKEDKLTKNDDSSESDEKPVEKKVEKLVDKKPRSQKQIDAFKKTQENRQKKKVLH